MGLKEYIDVKAEEFVESYFEDFYLDVIHRQRSFNDYMVRDAIFSTFVDNVVDYGSVELLRLLNKPQSIMTKNDELAREIYDDLYNRIVTLFHNEMLIKLGENVVNINDIERGEYVIGNIDTMEVQQERMIDAIRELRAEME